MSLNDEDHVDDEEIIVDNEVNEEETTETDPVAPDETEAESEESPETVQESEEDDDEDDRVVTIGDTEPESKVDEEEKQDAPKWVKKVRKKNRTLESENKKLQRQIEELTKPKEPEIKLGEEPTFASCDYDEARFKQEHDAYRDRKIKVEEQKAKQSELIKAQAEKRGNRQKRYIELKKEHKFKDYGDAESLVENTFNLTQQNIIVQGADDSALLVYALGKNPKKLEELSKVQDPVEFAFKVAKLESQLKVVNKKAPSPEKRVSKGKSAGVSGNSDKTLERLRQKAAESGDYTELTAYKKKLRG